MNVPKVAWLSASELLIVRSAVGLGATNDIAVFDLLQGSKRSLITPTCLSHFDYSLSPDRRLLAYWDGRVKHSIYGSLKVLDLKTGSVVATLGSGEDELLEPASGPLTSYLLFLVFTLAPVLVAVPVLWFDRRHLMKDGEQDHDT